MPRSGWGRRVSLSGDEEAVGIFGSTMMEAICWALRRAPSR